MGANKGKVTTDLSEIRPSFPFWSQQCDTGYSLVLKVGAPFYSKLELKCHLKILILESETVRDTNCPLKGSFSSLLLAECWLSEQLSLTNNKKWSLDLLNVLSDIK